MAKSKKLPKQVFMMWEEGAADEQFLSSAINIDDIKYADAEIGVYKLTKIRKFKLVEEKPKAPDK